MSGSHDSTRAAFDERARTYDNSSWHVRYARRLVDLAALAPGDRVLDAATGTGFAAIASARELGPTGRVVGVDISAGMLDRARQSIAAAGLTTIDVVQADATSLPGFADASFDVVLCSAGLLYMPVHAALREWRRLLVPGGTVGFSTMREGFPVAGRLFREHAHRYGLTLTDPASPLGTESRCVRALRDADITPTTPVAETVRFSPSDLDHAWDAHAHGSCRDAVAALDVEARERFREDYTTALAELLRTDEDRARTSDVIYAFGRT